ncbi:MAG: hypothetical protein K0R15_2373 [Clostridiales bacterium]|jgi:hypothetical protein|nr:hypothetical protein [Clostridiales bacterium]
MKSTLYVEYQGNKTNTDEFVTQIKKLWIEAGNKVKDIKNIEIYYKPEENKCYFVVNEDFSGSF